MPRQSKLPFPTLRSPKLTNNGGDKQANYSEQPNGEQATGKRANNEQRENKEDSREGASNKQQALRPMAAQERIGTFEKHTKGVGRKIMEAQGWQEGNGLGNGRNEGIKHAIKACGQLPSSKKGFGYESKEKREEEWQTPSSTRKAPTIPTNVYELPISNRYCPFEESGGKMDYDEYLRRWSEGEYKETDTHKDPRDAMYIRTILKEKTRRRSMDEEEGDEMGNGDQDLCTIKRQGDEMKRDSKKRKSEEARSPLIRESRDGEEIPPTKDQPMEVEAELPILFPPSTQPIQIPSIEGEEIGNERLELPTHSVGAGEERDKGEETPQTKDPPIDAEIRSPTPFPPSTQMSSAKEEEQGDKMLESPTSSIGGREEREKVKDAQREIPANPLLKPNEDVRSKMIKNKNTQKNETAQENRNAQNNKNAQKNENARNKENIQGSGDTNAHMQAQGVRGHEGIKAKTLGASASNASIISQPGAGADGPINVSNWSLPKISEEPTNKTTKKQKGMESLAEESIERMPIPRGRKNEEEEVRFWGKTKQKSDVKTKQNVHYECNTCQSSNCEDVKRTKILAPLGDEDDEQPNHDKNEENVENLLEHANWIPMEDDDRIKERPVIEDTDEEEGSKHRIVAIVNGKCIILQIDCGAFASIMHRDKAHELGLPVERLETTVNARSATGGLQITHQTLAEADLGSVRCTIRFLLVDSPRFRKSMILVGSSTLKTLNMDVDFKNQIVKINGILQIPMFDCGSSARDYIWKIKQSYASFKSTNIRMRTRIRVPPMDTRRVEIYLDNMDKASLSNTMVFFKANPKTRNGLQFIDALIQKDYPWMEEPLKVSIHNPHPTARCVEYGEKVGSLKPLVNRELLERLPGLDLENEVHLIEDLDDELVEDNLIAALEEGSTEDGRDGKEQEVSLKEMERNLDRYLNRLEEPSLREKEQKDKAQIKEVLNRVKKTLKEKDGGIVPEFREPPTETQEEVANFFRIPENIRNEIAFTHHENRKNVKGTKLTTRDDLTPAEVDALVEESQAEKAAYWEQLGRPAMISRAHYGSLLTPEQRKEAEDMIWEFRCTFADQALHLKAGIKVFAADFGVNGVEKPRAIPRPGNAFSKKLFAKYIAALMRANMVRKAVTSARANSFLVAKPKAPEGTRQVKTMADLTDDLPETAIFARWRLVTDLSKVNLCIDDCIYSQVTNRTILSSFRKKFFLTLDVKECFHQLKVTRATSEDLLTFVGPGDSGPNLRYCVTPMGSSVSSSLIGMTLNLIYAPIFESGTSSLVLYADNLIVLDDSMTNLLKTFRRICEANVAWNVGLKLNDVHIGYSTTSDENTAIDVLGVTIHRGKFQIPSKRRRENADTSKITTRKHLIRLMGMCSWYGHFSPAVAGILKLLREDMKAFKTRKAFVITDKMQRLIDLMVNIFVSSPGLEILSEQEHQDLPLICISDASKLGYGGTLVALRGSTIIPIRAHSKCWGESLSRSCSNRLETIAVYLVASAFDEIIQNKKIFCLTDSNYAKTIYQKEIHLIPPKLRYPVLCMRESYHFRIWHLAGKLNLISDLLSRYLTPDLTNFPELGSEKAHFVKTHMRQSDIPTALADEIHEVYRDYVNESGYDVEDMITEELRRNMPDVLQIDNISGGQYPARVTTLAAWEKA